MRIVQIQQHQIGCSEAGSQTEPRITKTRTSVHQIPILGYLQEGYNGFSSFL